MKPPQLDHAQLTATRRAVRQRAVKAATHDPYEPAERTQRRDALARRLRGLKWSYFISLSFRFPVDEGGAWLAVLDWLAPFGRGVYAAVVAERAPPRSDALGQVGDAEGRGRVNVHVLLGGLRRRMANVVALRRGWRRGMIDVRLYRGRGGAASYLYKTDAAVELIGEPLPYRPRRPTTRSGAARHALRVG